MHCGFYNNGGTGAAFWVGLILSFIIYLLFIALIVLALLALIKYLRK